VFAALDLRSVRHTEFFRTTGFRLGLAMAAVLVVGILTLSGFVFWYISDDFRARIDIGIKAEVRAILDAQPGELQSEIERHLHFDPRHSKAIGLFSPSRQALVGNMAEWPAAYVKNEEFNYLQVTRTDDHGHETHPAIVDVYEYPDGRTLFVGRIVEDLLELRAKTGRALLIGLSPAVALSILGGVILGLRTQKRLTELRRAAHRITAGHLVERLPTRRRGDDLDQLAAIVNSMLDEIAKLVNDIKGIGEDIAHDLRTPLTRVRARLERGRDHAETREELAETVDKAIAGIDQTLAIVTALLRIAEIEHDRKWAGFAPVDLGEIILAVAELYEPIADDKGLQLHTNIASSITVRGDKDLLMDAVANLVDNAVKFTTAPGEIRVELRDGVEGPMIRVADSGPGITDSEKENVLRRFYRSDKSRHSPGIGLGLNLVAAIAKQHGFKLSIGDGHPGCIIDLICCGDIGNRLEEGQETGRTWPAAEGVASGLTEKA
jgi:signal transduction histidine kinase